MAYRCFGSKAERDAYEEHRKWLMIEANTLKKAQADSFAEGKIEGKIEEKQALAIRLLNKTSDICFISEVTELPKEDILKLQKTMVD